MAICKILSRACVYSGQVRARIVRATYQTAVMVIVTVLSHEIPLITYSYTRHIGITSVFQAQLQLSRLSVLLVYIFLGGESNQVHVQALEWACPVKGYGRVYTVSKPWLDGHWSARSEHCNLPKCLSERQGCSLFLLFYSKWCAASTHRVHSQNTGQVHSPACISK